MTAGTDWTLASKAGTAGKAGPGLAEAMSMSAGVSKTVIVGSLVRFDPVYRFPCLLHWSWTTTGSRTFESSCRGSTPGCSAPSANLDPGPRPAPARGGRDRARRPRPAHAARRPGPGVVPGAAPAPPRRPECASPGPGPRGRPAPTRHPRRTRGPLSRIGFRDRPAVGAEPALHGGGPAAVASERLSGRSSRCSVGRHPRGSRPLRRELVVDRELALQLGRGLVAGITINPV
jgi:hypothetical protein